jgi:hypothetical protein
MNRILTVFSVLCLVVVTAIANRSASTYRVYRTTTSHACKVQNETVRPLFGEPFLGPFDKRDDAKKAMCASFKSNSENKCQEVNPADSCN